MIKMLRLDILLSRQNQAAVSSWVGHDCLNLVLQCGELKADEISNLSLSQAKSVRCLFVGWALLFELGITMW